MRNLIRRLLETFKSPSPSTTKGAPKTTASTTSRPGRAAASELRGGFDIEYSPSLDGDPDPGEVVWGWVPYEDDPSQGKDRPMVIIGRTGAHLVGVPLTSKQKQNEYQVAVGTGPWDREGRGSYAKVERLLDVDPAGVRREGAILAKQHFDDVVDGVRRHHGR
jgi:hypothetical protein